MLPSTFENGCNSSIQTTVDPLLQAVASDNGNTVYLLVTTDILITVSMVIETKQSHEFTMLKLAFIK